MINPSDGVPLVVGPEGLSFELVEKTEELALGRLDDLAQMSFAGT